MQMPCVACVRSFLQNSLLSTCFQDLQHLYLTIKRGLKALIRRINDFSLFLLGWCNSLYAEIELIWGNFPLMSHLHQVLHLKISQMIYSEVYLQAIHAPLTVYLADNNCLFDCVLLLFLSMEINNRPTICCSSQRLTGSYLLLGYG